MGLDKFHNHTSDRATKKQESMNYIYLFLKKTVISILTHSEHQQDTSAASAQSTRNT